MTTLGFPVHLCAPSTQCPVSQAAGWSLCTVASKSNAQNEGTGNQGLSPSRREISSGDIPNSTRCSYHPAALADPGGTLVEP